MICVYCNEYYPRVLSDHHNMVCAQQEEINYEAEGIDSDETVSAPTETGVIEQEAEYYEDNQQGDGMGYGNFNTPYSDTEDMSGFNFFYDRNRYRRTGRNTRLGVFRIPVRVSYYRNHGAPQVENELVDLIEHRAFMMINQLFTGDFFNILDQFMLLFHDPVRGLTEEHVNALEVSQYVRPEVVAVGEEDKCPICMVELETDERIRKLPCSHFFHPNCIDTWLVQNSRCPICKNDLSEYFGQTNI